MPIHHFVDDGVLHFVLEGSYDVSESFALLDRALDDCGLAHPVRLLGDIRGSAMLSDQSAERVVDAGRRFAAMQARLGRCALVVTPGLGYGIARQAGAYAENAGIAWGVFESIEDASRWLREG